MNIISKHSYPAPYQPIHGASYASNINQSVPENQGYAPPYTPTYQQYPPYGAANPSAGGNPWSPGVLKRVPWRGLMALVCGLGCAIGAAVVLISVDNKVTTQWPTSDMNIQPAVVLAVLTALGNSCIVLAFHEAATIAWWHKMLRGATVTESHRYYSAMTSVFQSILSLRHFSLVALACIATTILVIDGPLLQRAVKVSLRTTSSPASFSVSLNSGQFPHNFSGVYMDRSPSIKALTSNFAPVVQQLTARKDIIVEQTSCRKTCKGTIIGPGFDIQCTLKKVPYDIPVTPKTLAPGTTFNVGWATVKFSYNDWGANKIDIMTRHKASSAGVGDYTETNCTLAIATVEYPIEVTSNRTISLLPRKDGVNETRQVHDKLYKEASGLTMMYSAIGGFAHSAAYTFNSNVSLYYSGIYSIQSTGSMASTYLKLNNPVDMGKATMFWADPTPDIISWIRELAFRAAVSNSNSSTMQQVVGEEAGVETYYKSNFSFMAGALGLVMLAAGLTALLFFGWWRLGRKVTMSPVELAKAFGAPVLEGDNSNAEIEELLKQLGKKQVRYGVAYAEDSGMTGQKERLIIADSGRVSEILSGRIYR